ncbi:MAG: hypothetical protein SGI77_09435 [Pirellulaceae bacterium]|nr:hypothetical protein [Pirellulaceae bacterium]
MRSVPQALAWEFIVRGRWTVPGYFVLAISMPVLIYAMLRSLAKVDVNDPSMVMVHFTMAQYSYIIWAIGIASVRGPLSRLYTAPVSTASLVAWHLWTECAMVWLGCVAITWLMNTCFDVGWPIWGPALFAVACTATIRAIWWLTDKTLWSVVGIAAASIVLTGWLQSRCGGWFTLPRHYWTNVTPLETATLFSLIGISYCVAVFSVARNRCGERLGSFGIGPRLVQWFEAAYSIFDSKPRSFRSVHEAQHWYEWQQKGASLPAMMCLIFSMVCIVGLLHLWFAPESIGDFEAWLHGILVLGGLLSIFGAVAGFFMGCLNLDTLTLTADASTSKSSQLLSGGFVMGHFPATRPITTFDFAMAILRTAGKSLLIAWSMWGSVLVAFLLLAASQHELSYPIIPADVGYWFLPLTLLGPWITMTTVAGLALTGRPKLVFAICIGLPILCSIVASLNARIPESELKQQVTSILIAFVSVSIIAVILWAFWTAGRRALIPAKWMIISGIGALLLAFLAVVLRPTELLWVAYPMIVAFAALAVAPIATAPLAISWNRIR